jgi:epoxyqueuosine reductase
VRRPDPLPTLAQIERSLRSTGITHVGVSNAAVLADTRRELLRRRDAGLHDGMGFTYRDPQRSTDPRRAVPGATSVIVAARPYRAEQEPPSPPPEAGPHARVARYAWVDHYAPLRSALRDAARSIRRAGERAVAFADDNSMVDRAIAHRAGLGWFGKNANLLLPGAGSFFVLGCIVTTARYEPASGPIGDGCGTCRRCIDDCPTGAIIGPGVIDAGRCLSWILQKPGSIPVEFRESIGDRIYGCDDCQESCPVSVRLGHRHTAPDGAAGTPFLDAVALLEMSDDEIDRRYGHWYVADRQFRWVRRNALVVIGNTGRADDTRSRAVLERYRRGPDQILAEHAGWALTVLDARQGAAVP